MRSLFLKVFLWFWLAMVLVISALVLTTHLTQQGRTPRPPQFIEGIVNAYSHGAADAYERGGSEGLGSFARHLEREVNIRARLFDAGGAELSGAEATPDERELAGAVARAGEPRSKMAGRVTLEARPVRGYVFVSTLPLGPFPPHGPGPHGPGPHGPGGHFKRLVPPGPLNFLLGEDTSALAARLVAMILTAGVLCYMLARYIVSPVVKLREVTRQLTRGDLSARVGPRLGRRRDELAAMGHDFDEMASRVETLVSAQTRLLRDISHELRSPLARLTVALDLARKRSGGAAAADHDRIEREAKRLNEMIGQLLTLSRQETAPDAVPAARVDLDALVRDVAEDADFEAKGGGRSVVVAGSDACSIEGSPPLLRSAVENVVRNAVRHTPEGTSVKVSLRCSGEGDEGRAVIEVRDEGPGVPEDALADIFRPFFRVDDSRTRETGGTGLGLAITERTVRLHGGTVEAANVPGGGFVVSIRLPLGRGEAARAPR